MFVLPTYKQNSPHQHLSKGKPHPNPARCPDLEILPSLNSCLAESLTWCLVTFGVTKEKAKPAVRARQRDTRSQVGVTEPIFPAEADLDSQDLRTPQIFLKSSINHYTAAIFQMKTSDFILHASIHLFLILLWERHCFPRRGGIEGTW